MIRLAALLTILYAPTLSGQEVDPAWNSDLAVRIS